MLIVPEAFHKIGKKFHQDVFLVHATEVDAIASAVASMDSDEKKIAAEFLDQFLAGNPGPEEMARFWEQCRSQVFIGKGIERFLQMILEALAAR